MGRDERDNTADLIIGEDSQERAAVGKSTEPENRAADTYVSMADQEAVKTGENIEKEGKSRGRKHGDRRKRRARKGNHGLRMFLRFMQHTALAAMVVSMFIVAIGSTV